MARRKTDSPRKAAMREMMHDYLKNNDISIKNGTDVNSVMRDMMSVLLEGGYWMRNWTKNSVIPSTITATKIRITAVTDIPKRPYIPATETWMWQFPETEMENTNHSLSKNTRTP